MWAPVSLCSWVSFIHKNVTKEYRRLSSEPRASGPAVRNQQTKTGQIWKLVAKTNRKY